MTDLDIWSHSGDRKSPLYSRLNTVCQTVHGGDNHYFGASGEPGLVDRVHVQYISSTQQAYNVSGARCNLP